jgi:hypothetical protein
MLRFAQYFFSLLAANTVYGQNNQLQDYWWKAVKVIEVIKGDTTVYRDHKCNEPLSASDAPYLPMQLEVSAYFSPDSKFSVGFDPYRYTENNSTYVPVNHVPDICASGTWQITDAGNIEITLDQKSIKRSYDRNFSGTLTLLNLTDSAAVFRKEIVRNGDWTRTYHFVKR